MCLSIEKTKKILENSRIFLFVKKMRNIYKTKAWKKKREKILKRDNYLCVECKRYGRMREATTVHHIKPYDDYPELAFDNRNLMSLCDACHNKAHPEKGKASLKNKY